MNIKDGQWIAPVRKGFLATCCDCGAVHRVNFRVRKGVLQLQAFRVKHGTLLKKLNRLRQENYDLRNRLGDQ